MVREAYHTMLNRAPFVPLSHNFRNLNVLKPAESIKKNADSAGLSTFFAVSKETVREKFVGFCEHS